MFFLLVTGHDPGGSISCLRLKISPRKCSIKSGFFLRRNESGIGHLNRANRREAGRLYRQFIAPGDLCFDIGANTGELSQVMLKLGAMVVAVEPQRESVEAMRKRFAGNSNLVLIAKAAGAEVGLGKLMVCGRSICTTLSPDYIEAVTESGRLSPELFRWDEVREVPITTLDELIREYGAPVFTKIDVEERSLKLSGAARRS